MSTMPSRAELKRNLKLLKERLEARPMDLDARMRIARTYRLLDDAKDAVAHYGAVARYLSLAGHPLQAVAVLKELLQVDPRHEETLLFLAKLYARTRAADPTNRGRVAVPIIDAAAPGDTAVNPLTDGLPMTATGIWRAIRPTATDDLSVVHSADEIGAVVDDDADEVDDADIDALEDSLSFEEAVLAQVPLFASLDAAAFVDLSHHMVLVRGVEGETIFAEGDPGDSCIVIVKGEAVVTRRVAGANVERDRLGPGSVAGLFALVRAEARQATLQAATDIEYFEIDRAAIGALLTQHPAARTALAGVVCDRLVETLFLEMPLFAGLDADARATTAERFTLRELDDADDVLDALTDTDGLWLVIDGTIVVGVDGPEGRVSPQVRLQAGDWVVCAASLAGEPSGVTVQAVGPAAVAGLPHVVVQPLIANGGIERLGPSTTTTKAIRTGTLRR